MGKRRVRNLAALGHSDVLGFDARADRCDESRILGLTVFDSIDAAMQSRPDAVVICVPPDLHAQYIRLAIGSGIPFFTELNLVADHMQEIIRDAKQKQVLGFPSSTLRYFPGPKKIKKVVDDGTIGKPLLWTYHSGQYLPDWHPWERIQDYFVSKRATGGGREVAAIEMSWLTALFGYPKSVNALVQKVSDLPADIDDLYVVQLEYAETVRGQFTGDVIARSPIRHFRLLGSEGVLECDFINRTAAVFDAIAKQWTTISLGTEQSERGYTNPESPYIMEMKEFVECLKTGGAPSYTLEDDLRNLRLLAAFEESARLGRRIELDHHDQDVCNN